MNKLSYGLLSLLSTEPMSGYDLTTKINKFWRSTHSAIYPLLSELEEGNYIELTLIEQTGKPDKKIYHLTDKGKELLRSWFISETADEVCRDEMTLKLYCINCMDEEAAETLLKEYEDRCNKRIEMYHKNLARIKVLAQENPDNAPASVFGSYIMTQRGLQKTELDLKWCEWVRRIYKKKNLSFLKEDLR
ncbi:MAG: putative transcriptional regulator [Herbinix sp.]|jgi:DNA-binding PadR family transcriptional regulator|nr:putative transcriptional regulator [Herbinix sp.]